MKDRRTDFFALDPGDWNMPGDPDAVSNVIPDNAVTAAGVETADVSYEPVGQASLDDAGRAFAARVIAFAQTVPDYEEVTDAATVPIPQHVVDYLKTSPLGAALGYFLAKNLATCRRVARMPRAQASQVLRRLESKLQAPRLLLVHNIDDARTSAADRDLHSHAL